ncbi:MAG: type II toxin-antitoxin system VapC family toxin [Gammaproteobacteria bacterium]|nr:type II toxin-antitoxin system VapC family toxin [Gammaproteobacteria bacterium]
MTYLEFLGNLMQHERTKHNGQWELRPKEVNRLRERLKKDIGTTARHRFQLAPTMDGVFQYARALMTGHARRKQCELGTNDALHIAIARLMQPEVILVTSDGGRQRGDTFAKMKCVCQRIGLAFFDPEE